MEHYVKVSKMYNLESRTLRAAFSVQKEHMEGLAGRVRSLKVAINSLQNHWSPVTPPDSCLKLVSRTSNILNHYTSAAVYRKHLYQYKPYVLLWTSLS
jgi:hypothetical protein